jgi:pimeloyl-ACP methyl ester carboxylesterase
LLERVERAFGVRVPLAALFAGPTIARLAEQIRAEQIRAAGRALPGAPRPPLVELKSGSAPNPLFLVPGGNGGMPELALLARLLGRLEPEQSAHGLVAGEAGRSVEQRAADYLSAIREIQPSGPYLLGGECVGGAIAWEMAQQLRAAGERVGLLLLIEAWCPSTAGTLHYRSVERAIHWSRVASSTLSFAGHSFREHAAALASAAKGSRWPMIKEKARKLVRRFAGPPREEGMPPMNLRGDYSKACMDYRPRSYPGRATFLVSRGNEQRGLVRSWRAVCGGDVGIHLAPGDYDTYLKIHFEQTAELVKVCLEAPR